MCQIAAKYLVRTYMAPIKLNSVHVIVIELDRSRSAAARADRSIDHDELPRDQDLHHMQHCSTHVHLNSNERHMYYLQMSEGRRLFQLSTISWSICKFLSSDNYKLELSTICIHEVDFGIIVTS